MSTDLTRKQHQEEALAALEDGGQPLLARASDVESEATLVDAARGFPPPSELPPRRGRRGSRDRFKTMSMASSLGVGITSLTFTGSNVPAGDFGQGQYGCYDDFNVVNLRASQALGAPKAAPPKPDLYSDLYSHPSDPSHRHSYVSRRSYHEPSYRRSRASYASPVRPQSMAPPPVPPIPRQHSYPTTAGSRPSFGGSSTTDATASTDHVVRRRRFHALLAKLAELLPRSRWAEKKREVQHAQAVVA